MRYASIRKMDISNGESIGTSLFVQGCHFHCKNCFNKDTWDFECGKEWTDDVKEKFLRLVEPSHIKRISILGGEPLANENLEDVLELAKEIRLSYPEKTIWLYSGYTWEQVMYPVVTSDFNPERDKLLQMRSDIVKKCDVFVDGRYEESKRDVTYRWAGSTNQRVIDVKRTLDKGSVVLWESQ